MKGTYSIQALDCSDTEEVKASIRKGLELLSQKRPRREPFKVILPEAHYKQLEELGFDLSQYSMSKPLIAFNDQ